MVPNFALSLSFEGIALLRRTGAGWALIDEVPLDRGDLEAAVLGLRNRAEDLDPDGAQVLLVIPNEQIRYLDIPAVSDGQDVNDQVRGALDGATPYAMDELRYDHALADGRLRIAAVARETLNEAEGFAAQHGFVPTGYVAIADPQAFEGAVFFGPAEGWTGPATRPDAAIKIIAADDAALRPLSPPEQAPPDDAAPEPATHPSPAASTTPPLDGAPEPAPSSDIAPQPEASSDEKTPDAKPNSAATPEAAIDAPEETTEETPQDQAVPDAPVVSTAAAAKTEVSTPPPLPPAETERAEEKRTGAAEIGPDLDPPVAFSTIRATRGDGAIPPAPKAMKLGGADSPAQQVKPRFTPVASASDKDQDVAAKTDAPDDTQTEPAPKSVAAKKTTAPDTPKRGSKPAAKDKNQANPLARLAALRGAAKSGDAPAMPVQTGRSKTPPPVAPPGPVPPAPQVQPPSQSPKPAVSAPATPQSDTAPASARMPLAKLPGRKSRNKDTATPDIAAKAAATLTTDAERERMTVFGARGRDVGGKPRFLGLMLTTGLLLLLAGVAAWASVFLDDGLAGLFRSEQDSPAIAALPEVSDPELVTPAAAPVTTTTIERDESPDEDVQLAALDTGLATDAPDILTVPAQRDPMSPEEAAATYAATGIWQRAPSAPHALPEDGVDEIYVASIDPAISQFDAVALPDPLDMAQEPSLDDPVLPPPFGLTFDMDDRGLVRATPEGALTPEGLRIYAGLPPVVPPSRTARAEVITPEPAISAALSKFRPRTRPDGLIEQRERATLGGISRAELAAIRPVMRPLTAQEQAIVEDPEATATDQAVARSLPPVGRPRNMEAIVKRSQESVERPSAAPVQTAAVAPRTVKPSGTTGASVARNATVRNVINLNKINLIGVFGTPSKRRAMIRLANGKYKEVKVGDRLDGGRVTAIGDSDLRYNKKGRNVVLRMPKS